MQSASLAYEHGSMRDKLLVHSFVHGELQVCSPLFQAARHCPDAARVGKGAHKSRSVIMVHDACLNVVVGCDHPLQNTTCSH